MSRWSALVVVIGLASCGERSGGDPDANVGDDALGDAGDDAATCEDGATRSCGTDVGACSLGTETCVAGAWGSCEGGVAPAATELCDGVTDDDCDGMVDEDCTSDPFVAANCGGAPWTQAEAAAHLGAMARMQLASATIQVRTRTCVGMTCGAWSAGAPWQTRFLTYSGGVTTRYMNLQADTHLVLYTTNTGVQLSAQHVTFAAGGYADAMGMVFTIPPAPVMYPVFRAYNVNPQNMYDYRDLELTLKNGVLAVGAHCARFTATEFGASEPYTTEYAALYRW